MEELDVWGPAACFSASVFLPTAKSQALHKHGEADLRAGAVKQSPGHGHDLSQDLCAGNSRLT